VSPLFTDVVQCLGIPLLEIKKSASRLYLESSETYHEAVVVYLFLVCYGRSKADQIHIVIPSFLQVCQYEHFPILTDYIEISCTLGL
jgi:AP-2 complex subunit beta-1